jgi:protein tyrosine phosphatase (PTP) superfamily phosphohydrolase (DUF442 family)
VSLIDDNELHDPRKPQFQMEERLLKMHGVTLERIPVKLGGWPTKADVEKFLEIVKDKERQPVLVHCAQGVRRTGMMVAAYEEAVMGMSDEQAKANILTFGHSDRTANDVRRFIDGYDPRTGAVPEGMAVGEE